MEIPSEEVIEEAVTEQKRSKKERKEQNRQERRDAEHMRLRKQRSQKMALWGIPIGLALVAIGGAMWYAATRPPALDSEILSRSGLHWHPELTIYVNGVRQSIPPNLGLGAVHRPIHTHEDSAQGVVHMEFPGLVRERDATLGQFFQVWGKDMYSFGTLTRMTVNGEEHTAYENYVMRENDKIELYYD